VGLVLRLDPRDPDSSAVRQAAEVARQGGIVVFPTETVYGLGANLSSDPAIERVRCIKRRSRDLPLLVHCTSEKQARQYAADWPEYARLLARAFWPGPLALVVHRSTAAPDSVCAGRDTVGLRVVATRVTQELIDLLGAPLAGTSANLHGQPAAGRFDELRPGIVAASDVALDVGQCGPGVASTVLDIAAKPPRILRSGAVAVEQLEQVLRLNLAHGQ
jgi:L-threonylcarbamoyladenylate synthase